MQLLLEALTYYRGSDEPLSVVVILVVRATLAVATGWLASRAFSRSSAAVDHRVWLLAALATLVVPLLWALTPRWRMLLLTLHVHGTPGLPSAPVTAESVWPELLIAVWITGALAGLAYMILGIVLARRLFAASQPCRDTAWLDVLASVQRDVRMRRRVELRIAPCSMSPAVWSFRRVRILVPAESLAWPLALRRSVLLHELAHVARRDCAWQMIANLACTVWWFHPLVWYAAGRIRALAEQAADDCVIRAGQRRADYAQGLLTIANSLGWSRLSAVVPTMFHPSHLERRLRAILDPARRRDALGGRLSAASTLTACALMILLATLTSSVVHTVPQQSARAENQPAAREEILRNRVASLVSESQPSKRKADLNERAAALTALLNERQQLQGYLNVSPLDPRLIVQTRTPVAPPQPTMQLIPNWETGRHAEMPIPNYVSGTAQTLLVAAAPPPSGPSDQVVSTAPAAAVVQQAARATAVR